MDGSWLDVDEASERATTFMSGRSGLRRVDDGYVDGRGGGSESERASERVNKLVFLFRDGLNLTCAILSLASCRTC